MHLFILKSKRFPVVENSKCSHRFEWKATENFIHIFLWQHYDIIIVIAATSYYCYCSVKLCYCLWLFVRYSLKFSPYTQCGVCVSLRVCVCVGSTANCLLKIACCRGTAHLFGPDLSVRPTSRRNDNYSYRYADDEHIRKLNALLMFFDF